MIDRLLHAEIGDVASKLHTGRSRNDQVSTATRLWCIDACDKLDAAVRGLQQVMVRQAIAASAVAHAVVHAHAARAARLDRALDAVALLAARSRPRSARGGSPIRRRAAVRLRRGRRLRLPDLPCPAQGEPRLRRPSRRTASTRSRIAISSPSCCSRSSLLGAHLSRLAEDLILYGSSEFGFVRFGDAYTTGSSMMPQKRNPDAWSSPAHQALACSAT